MQAERIVENNVVSLIGIIVEECSFSHKVFSEGFYIFKVRVPRLSENEDILPVTVSERLIDVNLLKKGIGIEVKGQLRSYNYYSDSKNRLVLTVFARELNILEEAEEEIKGINEISINGFVCKAPVYRKTPFGREITDILVAANRSYNKSDYIPVITWGRNARFAGELNIGDNIKISGRIQSRVYRKKNGDDVEERTAYEVSVSKIEKSEEEE